MTETTHTTPPLPHSPSHAPVWLAEIIEWARLNNATDMHFYPDSDEACLWLRFDGRLREIARYSNEIHQRLIARLKVMGRCTDYEGELVQEGRFSIEASDAPRAEARLSIVPTLTGEKAVVRLLTENKRLQNLQSLGYPEALTATLQKAIDAPQGLLLAVGPSGSGKSTALYALLRDLTERTRHPLSIVTIEDPVEQHLPQAAQVTVDAGRHFNFGHALRAILRQDPEIVMVGEIRDAETAEAALQASLTGHRMISSMHTLNPAEALIRLRQMRAPAYVISSAVQGILNTRLLPLLCEACSENYAVDSIGLEEMALFREGKIESIAEPVGCEACVQTGYHGRTAIAEYTVPTAETANMLRSDLSAASLSRTLATLHAATEQAHELIRGHKVAWSDWQAVAGFSSPEKTTKGHD